MYPPKLRQIPFAPFYPQYFRFYPNLPTFAKPSIKEGGKVQKIKNIGKDEAVIEVGSGKYLYEVE